MLEFLLNFVIVFVATEGTVVAVSLVLMLLGNNDPLANDLFGDFINFNK